MLHEVAARRDYRRSTIPKRSREEDPPVQYPATKTQSPSSVVENMQPTHHQVSSIGSGSTVNVPVNDWDLSNFFSPKTVYQQPDQLLNTVNQSTYMAGLYTTVPQQTQAISGQFLPSTPYSPSQGQEQLNHSDGMADLFSLWADVPMAFRYVNGASVTALF